jgi:hypothetical protein
MPTPVAGKVPAALGRKGKVLQGRRSRHTEEPSPDALSGTSDIVVWAASWIAICD